MSPSLPKSILYVQSLAEIGGSDVALLRMIDGLDRARFRAVVALPAEGPLNDALRRAGATVYIVSSMLRLTTTRGRGYYVRYLAAYPLAVLQLARIIRQERIALIHTNNLHALHGFAAAFLMRRPHVWHLREIVLQSKVIGRIELFLARHFSARILAMSDAIAQSFGKIPGHLTVLHDGIDADRFHPRNDGSRVRAELHIAPQRQVIGIVCRLDHWKGVDNFLRAAALCHARAPHTTFVVAGGAIEGRESVARDLVALAESLGIRDVVRFTNWSYGPDRMPEVHAALDVLVLASVWPEPYGLVLLEAMATGKPVIATRHGGPLEICVEGETALLVPPADAQPMAAAMLELVHDPQRAAAMGAAGRSRIEGSFDSRHSCERLMRTYDRILSSRPC
jgi:glycosyltransferase involved in cell wall biosynthesis